MAQTGWLLLALTVEYGCAFAVAPLAWLSHGRLAMPTACCAAAACIAAPLLIPADHVGLRAIAMLASVDLVLKMIDFLRHRGRGGWDPQLVRDYCRCLIPFPALAVVYPNHKRRLTEPDRPGPHVLRIALGSICVAAGLL